MRVGRNLDSKGFGKAFQFVKFLQTNTKNFDIETVESSDILLYSNSISTIDSNRIDSIARHVALTILLKTSEKPLDSEPSSVC